MMLKHLRFVCMTPTSENRNLINGVFEYPDGCNEAHFNKSLDFPPALGAKLFNR